MNRPITARRIETDSDREISLDLGLDIFQSCCHKKPFNLVNNLHHERLCKAFEVTYLKI